MGLTPFSLNSITRLQRAGGGGEGFDEIADQSLDIETDHFTELLGGNSLS